MTASVGLIGIGEAGLAIGAGLVEAGATVHGYDTRLADDTFAGQVRATGITPVGSLTELADRSTVVICLTSARSALDVASGIAPRLGSGHVYSDWNSTSPERQRAVAAQIVESGARFADGAVMAAVPLHRQAVPVLLSGDGAKAFAEALAGLGMRLEIMAGEPGAASAVKMFRSLLVKGLEALLVECVAGAERYGAADRVLASMAGSLPFDDWRQLAGYLISRTAVHGDRRAEELRQVAATLRAGGTEPLLAEAGAARLQWCTELEPPAGPAVVAGDPAAAIRWLADAAGGR